MKKTIWEEENEEEMNVENAKNCIVSKACEQFNVTIWMHVAPGLLFNCINKLYFSCFAAEFIRLN